MYWRILFESCVFLRCWAALLSLCWSLFQLLNCWNSSLISAQTGFNRSQVICCTLVIHHKPGGTHKYILYDYAMQVRGHYLHDLRDQITNLFRLYELSQNVNTAHIVHSQLDSSASPGELLCQSLLSTSVDRWFSTSVFPVNITSS